jgi:two-component system nitrate/nitrite sensor histidine kinase NarX
VQGVVICARRSGEVAGLPLAAAESHEGDICHQVRCADGPDAARVRWHELKEARQGATSQAAVGVPIVDGESVFGVMPLLLAPGEQLATWQLELAQTVGRHLGAALSAAEARDEHRRLAMLEECSAIARELHDSLAQSLSYTKIQLTRLSAQLTVEGGTPPTALEVLQELREGVAAAYGQLRELLTTFRLKLNGKGLSSAVQEAAEDVTARTRIPVGLRNELVGPELSANQQIHVLQIVREALSNVEHHARARRVGVRLHRLGTRGRGQIEVTVEDDGVGIDGVGIATRQSPRHHFGPSIMRDRAHMLGGSIDVAQRDTDAPRAGTRVRLRFPSPAHGLREAEAPRPAQQARHA